MWAGFATLALYATLVLWLTWPLGTHLATHLPDTYLNCRFDTLHNTWALAWETHALVTRPSGLADANIFHPAPHALFYGPTALSALPFFAPIFLATGNPALAINVTLLACVALTAFGLHRVIVRWTGSEPSGFIAGWTLLTTPFVLWGWLPTSPSYAPLFFFPWIIMLAALPTVPVARAMALAALVALQCLADPIYVACAVVVPLFLLAVGRLARRGRRVAGLALIGALGGAAIFLLPVYVAYTLVRAENAVLQSHWSAPVGPVTSTLEPLLIGGALQAPFLLPWGRTGNYGPTGVPQIAFVLIALGALLALRGGAVPVVRRTAWAHAGLWAGVGILISIPVVSPFGGPPVRLPHFVALGHLVPALFGVIRSPGRLGIAALMGLALLAGLAFASCETRVARGRAGRAAALAIVLAGAMYVECLSYVPSRYPLSDTIRADSAIVRALQRPGGPLLELPVAGMEASLHAQAMYRSIFHWRPLLNGYSSYWPAGFPERMALAKRLPEAAALARLVRETGLETILVHAAPGMRDRSVWLALAEHGGRDDLRLVLRDGDDLLFAVTWGRVPPP